METTMKIVKELDGDFFGILADESADIADKEQMALCLRFVDKKRTGERENLVGSSPKRKEILKERQAEQVLKEIEVGEIESGSGLNQELGLSRPGDTRWHSHFKTILRVLTMYSSILDAIDTIGEISSGADTVKAESISYALRTFDFVFVAQLMVTIFGVTNELNIALQKKEQDIVNAVKLVDVTKGSLQRIRDNGWDAHLEKVSTFCFKNGIDIPNMDDLYVILGRHRRDRREVTNLQHFRGEVFLSVIDQILSEFNDRFNKKNLLYFEYQLDTFKYDVQNDDKFWNLKTLNELSMKLVETMKHLTYSKVYMLLKLVLVLPVATATVERAFSAMSFIKNRLRNSMGDEYLNDCLVTFLERDVFFTRAITLVDFQNIIFCNPCFNMVNVYGGVVENRVHKSFMLLDVLGSIPIGINF
ncbi:uncharacterized protein LOC141608336 [Silene latifolia]|uniref:uncharacterized protein LOC141608336 n=1 Tax=Silene latifolia TaxID=37657 RepID=UPI003D771453